MTTENKTTQSTEPAIAVEPVLPAVTADLYRTALKSDGSWVNECVCRDCAIKIHNDKKSKLVVYFDKYATFNFDGSQDEEGKLSGIDDDYDENIQIETCSICGDDIPRGDKNGNYEFEIPVGIESC
jgi:hypothetical protein